uniref:Uncharacterized protein n=1 Tax=Candidatus Kentrum sp. SD TaxID=2126332 RepID=A0A450YE01_9GAMM|nr:MAG: hypothetical protein BECKSD772F_GA0070984_104623 [Candidatus Kentron sp. SD]VFK45307.1 MAG: hypothetical protein BECKSD772F_GA0070984_12184 [Candidatus Kentron sp. SD]
MIEELEEETYQAIDLLKKEESKRNIAVAGKLLVKISHAIDENHGKLQQLININKASPSAYLQLYQGIQLGDCLFELKGALKLALDVAGKTKKRIEALKPKRYLLPTKRRKALSVG